MHFSKACDYNKWTLSLLKVYVSMMLQFLLEAEMSACRSVDKLNFPENHS